MGFSQGHSILWAPPCSGVGSSKGCRWISAPPWTSMGCRGAAFLTMVFSTGCRGFSALAPGVPPPPSSLTLVSAELFLLHNLTPLSCCKCCYAGLFLFLNVLLQSYYDRGWWAQPWSVADPSRRQLALALLDLGELLAPSHRRHSCRPSTAKTLPLKPSTMLSSITPRTDPWGTPLVTVLQFNPVSLITTIWAIQFSVHLADFLSSPYLSPCLWEAIEKLWEKWWKSVESLTEVNVHNIHFSPLVYQARQFIVECC